MTPQPSQLSMTQSKNSMTPLPTKMSKQSPPWKPEEMKILKDFETKTMKVEK